MNTYDEIQKAKSLIASGQRIEARQVLSALVQADPSSAQGWHLLSFVVDSTDQAIYCVERASQIDPLNREIHDRLILFKPQTQNQSQALASAAAAAASGPMPAVAPAASAAHANYPTKPDDQPIYSLIVILSILILFWLGIGLMQLSTSMAYSDLPGSANLGVTGFWNILISLINASLIKPVMKKKKNVIRSLFLLSIVGALLGLWQLLADNILLQACVIPLYIALGFFTTVEQAKFTNEEK